MTIEVPTPSAELLAQLEKQTIDTTESETAAIAAIRQNFARYAKYNGLIKTGSYHKSDGANYSIDRESFYAPDGRRIHGLLAVDVFADENTDQNRGIKTGYRLYLTETGEWLELARVGCWTRWQGEPSYWYASSDAAEAMDLDEADPDAHIRTMTDAEVAAEYDLDDLLTKLGTNMADMCKKLPERYNRLKANAELAQRTLEALKA